MPSSKPRVTIIGGGFGGLNCARELRRLDAELHLIDKRNHHLFQPLLYQVATAALSPANIATPLRKIVERQKNCDVIMGEVERVDLENKRLKPAGRDFWHHYDYLVIAAGARSNYFGNTDWEKSAPGLKCIEDALDVRRNFLLAFEQAELENDPEAMKAALTFVIVGAGPTGVELAGSLAEISSTTLRRSFRHFDTDSARVILIDSNDRVLKTFSEKSSERALKDLEKMGVEFWGNTRVKEVTKEGLVYAEKGENGKSGFLPANNVIWAAGVQSAALAQTLGTELDRGGRIVVGPDLSVPDHPEVFAIGDIASMPSLKMDDPVPGVAQGAIQAGRHVGKIIRQEIAALRQNQQTPKRKPFQYFDKGSMATIGRSKAIAEVGPFHFGGFIAWILWGVVHLQFLIGFRSRVLTLMEWCWMYLFFERGVRLITGRNVHPNPVKLPDDVNQPSQWQETNGKDNETAQIEEDREDPTAMAAHF